MNSAESIIDLPPKILMQPLMQPEGETIIKNEVKREIGILQNPGNAVLLGSMTYHDVS
jgi:hypothetical protein